MNCNNCGAPLKLFQDRNYFVCEYCATYYFPRTISSDGVTVLADATDDAGAGSGICPICETALSLAAVEEMRVAFARRRDLMVNGLNEIPGVRCIRPQGAFYALPECRELFGSTYGGRAVRDSLSLSEALLEIGRISNKEFEEMKSQLYQKEYVQLEAEQVLFQRKLELLGIIGDISSVFQ